MDLVNELQVSAERDDVLTVLRKARRLASKLKVDDINAWLRSEQNGYDGSVEIPAYRTVKGSLCFNTNGPIPVGYGMTGNGIMHYPGGILVDSPMNDSMSELISLVESTRDGRNGLFLQMHDPDVLGNLRQMIHPRLANQVTFMLKMSVQQVQAIPEAVKDRVLDWACELERRGILGTGMTFDAAEVARAGDVTFNISGSSVGQLSNMGKNIQGKQHGEI